MPDIKERVPHDRSATQGAEGFPPPERADGEHARTHAPRADAGAALLPYAANLVLLFAGLAGTFLPVITAFALPVQLPPFLALGALLSVYIVTMFTAAGNAALGGFDRRIAVPMLLLLAFAWLFIAFRAREMLQIGAETAISGVVDPLARAIPFIGPIDAPSAASRAAQSAGCTLFFAMLAVPVLLLYGWSVVYFAAAAPCMVVSLPFFAIAMIVMDYPPALYAVLCTLLFWALLLLPASVRRASPKRSAVLLFCYLPVLLLLFLAVLGASPRERYERAMWPEVLRVRLIDWRSNIAWDPLGRAEEVLPFDDDISLGAAIERVSAGRADTNMRVDTLGPRRTSGTAVLEVTASRTGALYLRGTALGVYDGRAWRAAADAPDGVQIAAVTAAAVQELGTPYTVTVHHLAGVPELMYVPYYAVSGDAAIETVGEVYARMDRRAASYAWTAQADIDPLPATASEGERAYRAWVDAAYTQLPETLSDALIRIAASMGIDRSMPREEIVSRVADAVRRIGAYDLDAARVPNGEDFILWFLNESRRGYCVHFASAATAMLQSLGVPARYVSGYRVDAIENETIAVTDSDAHAWVEVYCDGFGWMPVEVTSGAEVRNADAHGTEENGAEGGSAEGNGVNAPTPSPALSGDAMNAPTAIPDFAAASPTPVGADIPQHAGGLSGANGSPGTGELPGEGAQALPGAPGDASNTAPFDAQGAASGSAPGTPGAARRGASPLLLLSLLPFALFGTLALRRHAVLQRRHARLSTASHKRRILAAWRELQRLTRYGVTIPDRLTDIALEARFSDHGMTAAQADAVTAFLLAETARLRRGLPPHKRWAAMFLRAVL